MKISAKILQLQFEYKIRIRLGGGGCWPGMGWGNGLRSGGGVGGGSILSLIVGEVENLQPPLMLESSPWNQDQLVKNLAHISQIILKI